MSKFAKIFGWIQFCVTAAAQVLTQPGAVHGWQGWVTSIASLAAAIGIHGAASTDGSK